MKDEYNIQKQLHQLKTNKTHQIMYVVRAIIQRMANIHVLKVHKSTWFML